jgi:undecaprenyl-diphosphatase
MLAAIILGLVQGVSEFLPISSSGHLAVFGRGQEDFGLYAIVMFHAGTLLAIVAYYYRDVWTAMRGGVRLVLALFRAALRKESLGEFLRRDTGARIALIIIVGSIPTAAIGLLLKDFADLVAGGGHLKFVGGFFIITAAVVYLCDRLPVGLKGIGSSSIVDALVVGIFQGFAVMPGLSRSGLTIFAGVMRGVERRDAARLSFLMSVPAMVGAGILEAAGGGAPEALAPALVGALVAFASGYASIMVLVKLLATKRLRYFAGYLVALGVFVFIWIK